MEQENREFMQLLEASGWSQAEAARRLHLAPSNISQYKSNTNRPSRQVLELFKLLLLSENSSALKANASKATESVRLLDSEERELAKLPPDEREEVIKLVRDVLSIASKARGKKRGK